MFQHAAVYCSVLHCVAACCSVMPCDLAPFRHHQHPQPTRQNPELRARANMQHASRSVPPPQSALLPLPGMYAGCQKVFTCI